MENKSIERIAEELGVNFYDLHPYILIRESLARKEVVEWILDNKGVCLADLQWQAKLKEWGID